MLDLHFVAVEEVSEKYSVENCLAFPTVEREWSCANARKVSTTASYRFVTAPVDRACSHVNADLYSHFSKSGFYSAAKSTRGDGDPFLGKRNTPKGPRYFCPKISVRNSNLYGFCLRLFREIERISRSGSILIQCNGMDGTDRMDWMEWIGWNDDCGMEWMERK
ncbi:hypothetical protein EVAR_62911_1 [Eumeta japonica]|uniref:Uncharacterized protein n=1 Tax=Eumeta variegata TaxID=151549 RepID=A0A4C1YB22_EUMVA|nr:hypothetical protein EVAR_62911_1 [Eumeta japonica]